MSDSFGGLAVFGLECVQQGGAVLMGGGTDVEAAFIWHSRHARGGDFVIFWFRWIQPVVGRPGAQQWRRTQFRD